MTESALKTRLKLVTVPEKFTSKNGRAVGGMGKPSPRDLTRLLVTRNPSPRGAARPEVYILPAQKCNFDLRHVARRYGAALRWD